MKFLPLAATLLCTAAPVWADITPEQVLAGWQESLHRFGYDFTIGAQDRDSTTLTLTDVGFGVTMAEMSATSVIPWIRLTALEDGSVDISLADTMETTTIVTMPGAQTQKTSATASFTGLVANVSGTPEDIYYRYSIDSYIAAQDQTAGDGFPAVQTRMEMTEFNGIYRNRIIEDDTYTFFSDSTIGNTVMTVEMQNKALGFNMSMQMQLENVSSQFNMTLPSASNLIGTLFSGQGWPAGFGIDGTMEAGQASINTQSNSGGRSFTFNYQHGNSSLGYLARDGVIGFDVAASEPFASVASDMPDVVPFRFNGQEIRYAMRFPFEASESPADFSFLLNLTGVTISDNIWNMFDPNATLSRDPASLEIDLSGSVKLMVDLFNPSSWRHLRAARAELRSLTLNTATLDIEGLGLNGSGTLTFDNTRIDPISNMPEPTGSLSFNLVGALALLDKIGQLGVIDPAMVFGAKGALGMFATPGDAPDSFSSEIEFAPGGHIIVNGQQVK